MVITASQSGSVATTAQTNAEHEFNDAIGVTSGVTFVDQQFPIKQTLMI